MQNYGQGWGYSPFSDFRCPSGVLCQIKTLDVADLVGLGAWDEIEAMDLAGEKTSQHAAKAQGKRPQDRQARKLTRAEIEQKEKEQIAQMMKKGGGLEKMGPLVDKIFKAAVVQPIILSPYDEHGDFIDPEDRDPDCAYEDAIAFGDKMAIFSKAMEGISTSAKSDGESEKSLESVSDEPDSEY